MSGVFRDIWISLNVKAFLTKIEKKYKNVSAHEGNTCSTIRKVLES